jgi:hypothetical protein
MYARNMTPIKMYVFLSNTIKRLLLLPGDFGEAGTETGPVSEDFSGTVIFFLILCFFDILP